MDQYRLMKIFRESLPSNLRIALAAKDNAEHIDTLIDHFEGVIRTSERELWLQAKTTPLPAPPPRDNYREQPREEQKKYQPRDTSPAGREPSTPRVTGACYNCGELGH